VARDPSGAYIHNVFVFPESRRMGIFGALVEAAKEWANARGVTRLYTSITRDNVASERAHAAVGFRTVVGSVTVVRIGRREWKRVVRPSGKVAFDLLA
jgi:GNAT superfamily N-acetyltransferase